MKKNCASATRSVECVKTCSARSSFKILILFLDKCIRTDLKPISFSSCAQPHSEIYTNFRSSCRVVFGHLKGQEVAVAVQHGRVVAPFGAVAFLQINANVSLVHQHGTGKTKQDTYVLWCAAHRWLRTPCTTRPSYCHQSQWWRHPNSKLPIFRQNIAVATPGRHCRAG